MTSGGHGGSVPARGHAGSREKGASGQARAAPNGSAPEPRSVLAQPEGRPDQRRAGSGRVLAGAFADPAGVARAAYGPRVLAGGRAWVGGLCFPAKS